MDVPKLDMVLTADGWEKMGEALKRGAISIEELGKAFAATSRGLVQQSTVTARSVRAKTISLPRSTSTFKAMGVDPAITGADITMIKGDWIDDLDAMPKLKDEWINEHLGMPANTAAATTTTTHTADAMRLAVEDFQRREREHHQRIQAKLLAQRQAQLDRIEQELLRRHIPTTVSDEVGSW